MRGGTHRRHRLVSLGAGRAGPAIVAAGLAASALTVVPSLAGAPSAWAAPPEAITQVSLTSAGEQPNDESGSGNRGISADGRYVVFDSWASDVVAGDTNDAIDVFVHDRDTGVTERVSVTSGDFQASGGSNFGTISADGRYVAFVSDAADLVPGDTNGAPDIFVRDRAAATTERVSISDSGIQATGESAIPSISADGGCVAFASAAGNLVSGDFAGGPPDAFVRDRVAGTTVRASVADDETDANDLSSLPAVSADCRFVAFASHASNLVPGDTNGASDIFVRDLEAGTTERVSVSSAEGQGGGDGLRPVDLDDDFPTSDISADGRYVAFETEAVFSPADANGAPDVYLRDRQAGTTELVSVSSSETAGNSGSELPSLSPDGRYVVFDSLADNLAPLDDNFVFDVFLRDRVAGTTERVNTSSSGNQGDGSSALASVSADGRFVVFNSFSTNLVPGGSSGLLNAFVRDRSVSVPPPKHLFIPSVPRGQTYGPGGGAHGRNPSRTRSDPVNTATGFWTASVTDVLLPGAGVPFELTRSYTSGDTTSGVFGPGWASSLEPTLLAGPDDGRVLRAEDGQQLAYALQPDGTFAGAPGALSTLAAAGDGHVLTRHDQVAYRFDTEGKVTSIEDRNGQGLAFAYGGDGLLDHITDSAGRVVGFDHDSAGLLTRATLPDGRAVAYGYTAGMLTSVVGLRGETTSFTYDGGGRLASVTDGNGHVVAQNTYGSDGRVVEQLDGLGNRSTFSWDATSETSTMTDALGSAWVDVYSGNVLVRSVDPLGNTTAYGYDADVNVTDVTDPRGNTLVMTYDDRGNLLSRVAPQPLGFEETFTWDAQNNVITARDRRGSTTTFGYDTRGNLTSMSRADGAVVTWGRDATTGLVRLLTDARGETTTFDYDDDNNLVSSTSPLGSVTALSYDAAGRVTGVVEPRGNVAGNDAADYRTTFAYDAGDNLLTQIDPLGHVTTFAYDAVGNRTAITDAAVKVTSYAYDATDRLVSVTAPDATVTSFAYDVVGNRVSRSDGNGHTTTWAYDAANRVVETTTPTGSRTTASYDANGNQIEVVDANGNATPAPGDGTTAFSYDALDRLVAIDYGNTTPDVTLAYDANGNRTSMSDDAGTEVRSYDALGRPVTITRAGESFAYEYDAGGNVVGVTYPDGTVVTRAFDRDSRLVRVEAGGAETTYEYDAASNVVRTQLPAGNGVVETRDYDRAGRLVEVVNDRAGVTVSSESLARDAVGNPLAITTDDGQAGFTYDERHRLTGVCYAASCPGASDPFIRYGYDAVGNRTIETRPTGSITYAYDDADQLVRATGPGGPTLYEHDRNGNMTRAGAQTFAYDLANRLVSAAQGGSQPLSYHDLVGAASPTAYYRLGEASGTTAVDASGNGNDGTYRGGAGLGSPGALAGDDDTAASFDGVDDFVSVPDTGDPQRFSVETWVSPEARPASFFDTERVVVSQAYEPRLLTVSDKGAVTCRVPRLFGSTAAATPKGAVTPGQYAHLACTFDGRSLVVYVNGVERARAGVLFTPRVSWGRLEVGRLFGLDRVASFAGLIDEVALYGEALSPADVLGHFEAGSEAPGPGGTTTAYTYDGDGRRLSAATGDGAGEVTRFSWDPLGIAQVALERDGAGALVRRYAHGPLGPISVASPAGVGYYLRDHIGSITDLTDEAGASLEHYAYEPFGTPRSAPGTTPIANPVRFAGEHLDANTGLYNLRARQYDPALGRFTAPDPLDAPDALPSVSAYIYADNRPGVFVDPLGLWIHQSVGRAIGGVVGGVADFVVDNPGLAATIGAGALCAVTVLGCVPAGLAALGISTFESTFDRGLWPGGKPANWFGFGVDSAFNVGLWGGAGRARTFFQDGASGIRRYLGRVAVSEFEAASNYAYYLSARPRGQRGYAK